MKLSCLQNNLNRGLGGVGRAVATRSALPITSHILLSTDEGRLKLSATNLEIALSCWIGAKVEEEGAIAVPARLLTEFVASLPEDRLEMAMTRRTLQVRCGRFEARINGVDAGDFPPVPKVTEGVSTTFDPEVLRTGIQMVVFAAAAEDTRPVLTGINVELEEDRVTLAAADGFRLAVHHLTVLSPVARAAAIIPGRALSELGRLIADEKEAVAMMLNSPKGQVLFRFKNGEMVSQLIQGTFPNYTQLIPSSYQTRVVVNRAEFLRATRIASLFARDGSGIVRIVVTPGGEVAAGKITVSARSEEVADNVGEIDAMVSGGEAKIAFNGRYLTDVLGVLKEEQVALETSSPSSPGVLRPVGNENYLHVVMPMFVQW